MKLLVLMLGLMMSLMMSRTSEAASVHSTIMYINRFIEALTVEFDIKVDRSGDPATPGSKWLKGRFERGYNIVQIDYYLSGYTSRERSTIRYALYSVESGTCIRFRQLTYIQTLSSRPYLHIYPGIGCWTYIGMKWNMRRQYLSLSRYGCLTRPIIQHIMMHVLGFTHEISRPDRDKYFTVYFDNVDTKRRHYFHKYGSANQVTTYDYQSILHMDRNGYNRGRSGSQTLERRDNRSAKYGQATEMSSLDRLKINRYYECS